MMHQQRPRPAPQERPVLPHSVPREDGLSRGRHVALHVGQQLLGRGVGTRGRRRHGGREPALAVCTLAPLAHAVHDGRRLVHDDAEAGLVDHVEGAVGDEAEDLDDDVDVRVQASHLCLRCEQGSKGKGRGVGACMVKFYLTVDPDEGILQFDGLSVGCRGVCRRRCRHGRLMLAERWREG